MITLLEELKEKLANKLKVSTSDYSMVWEDQRINADHQVTAVKPRFLLEFISSLISIILVCLSDCLFQDVLGSLNLPRENSVKFVPSHSSRISQPAEYSVEPSVDNSLSSNFNHAYSFHVHIKNGNRSFYRDLSMFGTCTVREVSKILYCYCVS